MVLARVMGVEVIANILMPRVMRKQVRASWLKMVGLFEPKLPAGDCEALVCTRLTLMPAGGSSNCHADPAHPTWLPECFNSRLQGVPLWHTSSARVARVVLKQTTKTMSNIYIFVWTRSSHIRKAMSASCAFFISVPTIDLSACFWFNSAFSWVSFHWKFSSMLISALNVQLSVGWAQCWSPERAPPQDPFQKSLLEPV